MRGPGFIGGAKVGHDLGTTAGEVFFLAGVVAEGEELPNGGVALAEDFSVFRVVSPLGEAASCGFENDRVLRSGGGGESDDFLAVQRRNRVRS